MDNTECTRNSFPPLPSGIKLGSFVDKSTEKRKQFPLDKKKSHGNIIYSQNPLFNNITIDSLQSFQDNTGNGEIIPINCTSSSGHSKHCLELFASGLHFQKPQLEKCKSTRTDSRQKSRKDRMKARAETRRDILINESSDEDLSSINSSGGIRLPVNGHKNCVIMEDAYNKKSRSARTERYFRRLSKDDGIQNNDVYPLAMHPCQGVQNTKIPLVRHKTQSITRSNMNNPREWNHNLVLSNQDGTVSNNPIYNRQYRTEPSIFYNKHSMLEKTKTYTNHREFLENRAYGANVDYHKAYRSDPSSNAILVCRNNKSPRTLEHIQYVEPKIINYQRTQRLSQPTKPLDDSNHRVRRSYSFQSEVSKERECTNDIFSTIPRMPTVEARKFGNNLRNEQKWIDSIVSSVSSKSSSSFGHEAADLQLTKDQYVSKGGRELAGSNTRVTKVAELAPTYDSNRTKLLVTVVPDKVPEKNRNSKDLGKELLELESMYNSLRLSDDNLLERAEERCVEEFTLKGQSHGTTATNQSSKYLSGSSSCESVTENGLAGEKYLHQSNEAHVINDDMAYRKMQSSKMPALSETQNSLSQISYLLTSSAMILDKTDYPDVISKAAKEEPNITKDDVVYRNLHYANNVLKVIDPQPPFGIPLRPATLSTNSNYLSSTPVALKSPPLKYVPESEPNLITDDLAFRNLRKDTPKSPPSISEDKKNEVNVFLLQHDSDKSFTDDNFCRKKKKAVRSLSANLYGLINEVSNLQLNVK